jgi:hypothetical protein
MEAHIFKFTADDLRKIERHVLGFLISSGHCCNEIVALMPFIVFEHALEDTNEVEAALILARRYTVDRIVVSKIVGYDEMCSKFFRSHRARTDNFYLTMQGDYGLISDTIKAKRWARLLRNKTSFHYDEEYASTSLDRLDSVHPLRMIVGRISGITLFEFSEEVLSRPIFEEAGLGDIGKGMTAVNQFILESIAAIRKFHSRSMIAAFRQYGLMTVREISELREYYCGIPGTDHIPLSISSEYIADLKKS